MVFCAIDLISGLDMFPYFFLIFLVVSCREIFLSSSEGGACAAIEALAIIDETIKFCGFNLRGDGIGDLDFPDGARTGLRDRLENVGLQDVAPDQSEVGGRLIHRRFLDDPAGADDSAIAFYGIP